MNRLPRALCLSLSLAGLATIARAQGTDSCTTPTAIAGTGVFPFDSTAATTGTEGQTNALCNISGQIGIDKDIWFAWTAPSTATMIIRTCGGAHFDTKLAVYSGTGCPVASALVCDDDGCALVQSSVSLAVSSGSVYTIQVGSFHAGNSVGGVGRLTIVESGACHTSTGPDVIVGDIQDIANFNSLGGIDAISLGTTSCNIGSAVLGWHANTTNHPVIGGNLYRYRVVAGSGRFEQIGLSWLKHGFFAESETVCCSACQASDGTYLGIDCSDPYTASRNGGQNGAGPRWQVNAHTGAFTYPPANPAHTGSVSRRLEYLTTDVDLTAGVRYFGEAQYVTPDDSGANNQNNNASYHEVAPNGTGTSFSLVGLTQRALSAIRAWQVVDPAVVLTDVQVSGDGLFVVGFRTTSLGAGQYHYEYAIYNMNADRNGGSFTIPLPAGVTLSNVDFHDVTYRDTDGYNGLANFSGTDWTVTQTASSITWACETVGVNSNANALRWGTTYNFRFDANAAPTLATATIGLWKTGSPSSVPVNVEIPAGASSFVYCAGDGSITACPCANNSGAGNGEGCLNSGGLGGKLRTSGVASIAADTLVLQATNGLPFGPGLFFQGSAQLPRGSTFGNGILCVTGVTPRLEIQTADGTGASATTVAIHVLGSDSAGDVRDYQLWYRDGVGYCVNAGFNVSNAVSLTWVP